MPAIVAAETTSREVDAVTSHDVALPSGIQAGDLLLVFIALDGSADAALSTVSSPGARAWNKGWADELESAGHNFGLRWRIADGGEGSTATFTSTPAEQSAHHALRITGHDDTLSATRVESSSSGTAPDAPSHAPPEGSAEYLWIAAAGWDNHPDVTAYPSSFTDGVFVETNDPFNGGVGCVALATARRTLTASSLDPGAFTIAASEDWSAATIAIPPGAGDVIAPELVSATVDEDELTLTYDEPLDAGSTPAGGAYNVEADGAPIAVSTVTVTGSTVELVLASPVAFGDVVTIDYTPGGSPVQDLAGNDAAALADEPVSNLTPEPPPPPDGETIESVELAGVPVAGADVFASVTIRHGRADADDAALASSATLSLLNVTREQALAFRVGDELRVYITGAVPRFTGRITDAELDGAGTLALVAIGRLARILKRPVGAEPWPAEPWSDRVTRAFTEAGELASLELEIGADDPELAARAADTTTLGTILAELAVTVAAAVADLPDGRVLVQALDGRSASPFLALDPARVSAELPWTQTEDVTNEITVEHAGGSAFVADQASVDRFDHRPDTIKTTLADAGDAEIRARRELMRRAWPAWALDSLSFLRGSSTLAIGERVLLEELPPAAPKARHVGVLEGWEDRFTAEDGDGDGDRELVWSMELNLSPAILSGAGVTWAEIDPARTWADALNDWIETEESLA